MRGHWLYLQTALVAAILTACGGGELSVNSRSFKSEGIKRNSSSNATVGGVPRSNATTSTVVEEPQKVETKFAEGGIQLVQELDLDSLVVASVNAAAAAESIGQYLEANNISVALLEFCNQTDAACQLAARDLTLSPIAKNNPNFEVIGILTEERNDSYTLPAFMKLDDHERNALVASLMESPEKDLKPYFALVFRGVTKQGVVWKGSIGEILHVDLAKKVEAFLKQIGA